VLLTSDRTKPRPDLGGIATVALDFEVAVH
jgi:hypothetical protein